MMKKVSRQMNPLSLLFWIPLPQEHLLHRPIYCYEYLTRITSQRMHPWTRIVSGFSTEPTSNTIIFVGIKNVIRKVRVNVKSSDDFRLNYFSYLPGKKVRLIHFFAVIFLRRTVALKKFRSKILVYFVLFVSAFSAENSIRLILLKIFLWERNFQNPDSVTGGTSILRWVASRNFSSEQTEIKDRRTWN